MRRALTRFTASALAGALLFCRPGAAATLDSAVDSSAVPPIDSATSLLVVSPHPDDETLCCGGVIQRVAHAGGRVAVVWLTSGDAARIDLILRGRSLFPSTAVAHELGEQRMGEARAATMRLGVAASGQLFLGYPDGGLQALLGKGCDVDHKAGAHIGVEAGVENLEGAMRWVRFAWRYDFGKAADEAGFVA